MHERVSVRPADRRVGAQIALFCALWLVIRLSASGTEVAPVRRTADLECPANGDKVTAELQVMQRPNILRGRRWYRRADVHKSMSTYVDIALTVI